MNENSKIKNTGNSKESKEEKVKMAEEGRSRLLNSSVDFSFVNPSNLKSEDFRGYNESNGYLNDVSNIIQMNESQELKNGTGENSELKNVGRSKYSKLKRELDLPIIDAFGGRHENFGRGSSEGATNTDRNSTSATIDFERMNHSINSLIQHKNYRTKIVKVKHESQNNNTTLKNSDLKLIDFKNDLKSMQTNPTLLSMKPDFRINYSAFPPIPRYIESNLPFDKEAFNNVANPIRTSQAEAFKKCHELVPYYHDWKVILRNPNSNQIVLYNQVNHELAVATNQCLNTNQEIVPTKCKLCHQNLPVYSPNREGQNLNSSSMPSNSAFPSTGNEVEAFNDGYFANFDDENNAGFNTADSPDVDFMDRNYFKCLAISHAQNNLNQQPHLIDTHHTESNPSTRPQSGTATPTSEHAPFSPTNNNTSGGNILSESSFNEGYYHRFFKEGKKLGRGASGNVFLCQHVLDNIQLGRYAIKKVSIGNDHKWLARMLREVHMLEKLRHPNIIDYKHAWIENHQVNAFSPYVPCLFILMECANGGNLEEYITRQLNKGSQKVSLPKDNLESMSLKERAIHMRRQNALKREQKRRDEERKNLQPIGTVDIPESNPTPTNPTSSSPYLTLREIWSLFLDICNGLAHLHRYNIVHRDIKPPNLLLSFKNLDSSDEIPTVLISDFGECEDLNKLAGSSLNRTGATGTMEFMAPELLEVDSNGTYIGEHSPKADMWSLGMILYYLCYSALPYRQIEDLDQLQYEIVHFKGPIKFPDDAEGVAPRIPSQFKHLISLLLSHNPSLRPSLDEILANAKTIHFQQLVPGSYLSGSSACTTSTSTADLSTSTDRVNADSNYGLRAPNSNHIPKSSSPLKPKPQYQPDDIKPEASSSDKLNSSFSSVNQPLLKPQPDALIPDPSLPLTGSSPFLGKNLVFLGAKMGTLLFSCYPRSVNITVLIPLTLLALYSLNGEFEDFGYQTGFLMIHLIFFVVLYVVYGSVCGV